MTPPKIRLDAVSRTFANPRGGLPTAAVENFSLDVAEGSFVCLLGPSGCGKSTALNLIAGFERPDCGAVTVDGEKVTRPGPDRGVVFQEANLLPWRSVIDNITLGAEFAGWPRARAREQARRFIRLTGLEGFESHAPYELSGGMRQRVALARAWIAEPPVLLMDEPFGALDAQTRLSMQELLIEVWRQARATIVFVTHDVDEALFLGDRIVVMSARPGRIVEDRAVPFGRPREYETLVRDPEFGELKHHILHAVRHPPTNADA